MKRSAQIVLLLLLGVLMGLLAMEGILRATKLPRFYKVHSSTPQFEFVQVNPTNAYYVNAISTRIRFVYDGNPRGYFGAENEVDSFINASGFRGPEFKQAKPPRTLRIACIGDSVTFGEGVRFEDTYPERIAIALRARLAAQNATCESFNFGVGGYNTEQELFALLNFALPVDPDIVVVGYTLNDPEASLFQIDPRTSMLVRSPRELAIPEGLDDALPPKTIFYRSRIAQLCWQKRANRARTRQTVAYYQNLFSPDSSGWQRSRLALRAIVAECQARRIPCVVVVFPVLYQLNDRYPFMAIHRMLQQEVVSATGVYADLFPLLKGRSSSALWVHPTDPHPNEVVHAFAAEALSARIVQTPRFQEFLESLARNPSR